MNLVAADVRRLSLISAIRNSESLLTSAATVQGFNARNSLSRNSLSMKTQLSLLCCLLSLGLRAFDLKSAEVIQSDLCVYGGTSGGVTAAVQATRMGKTAVIVEPGRHVGGLSSGGLSATDIGNKAAIAGISREFYQRVAAHYRRRSSWALEAGDEYFSTRRGGQTAASTLNGPDATMWTFEPHVAEDIFYRMINEAKAPIYFGQRLASVKKQGARIVEIAMENGKVFRAKMF